MKKVLFSLFFIPMLLLTACYPDVIVDEDEPLIVEDITPVSSGGSSVATCTAQSTEAVDLLQPGDWVTGPDDYSVTLIEYGDFQ